MSVDSSKNIEEDFFCETEENCFFELAENNEIDKLKTKYFQDELDRLKNKEDFFDDVDFCSKFDSYFLYGKRKGILEGFIEYFKKL